MNGQTALRAKQLFDQLDTSTMSPEELQLHGQIKQRLEREPAIAIAMRRAEPTQKFNLQPNDQRGFFHSLANAIPLPSAPGAGAGGIPVNSEEMKSSLLHMLVPGLSQVEQIGSLVHDPSFENFNRHLNPLAGPAEQIWEGNVRGGVGSALPFLAMSLAAPFVPAPETAVAARTRLPEVWNGPEPFGTMPIREITETPGTELPPVIESIIKKAAAAKAPIIGPYLVSKLLKKISQPTSSVREVGQVDLASTAAYGDAPDQPLNPFKPRNVPATQFEPRGASGRYAPRKSIPLKSDSAADVAAQAGHGLSARPATAPAVETRPARSEEAPSPSPQSSSNQDTAALTPRAVPSASAAERIERNRQANLAATRKALGLAEERERTTPIATRPAPKAPANTAVEPSTMSTPKGEGTHTHTFTNPRTGENVHRVELKDGSSTVVPASAQEPATTSTPAGAPTPEAGTPMRWKSKSGQFRTGKLVSSKTDETGDKRIFHLKADHLPKNSAPVEVPEERIVWDRSALDERRAA